MKPADAQYRAYGDWFKVGRYNKIFRWMGGQWMASTLSIGEIRNRDRSSKVMTERVQAASARREARAQIETKKCKGIHGCGKVKTVAEFMKQNAIYYFSHCRDCEKLRQKNYRRAA